MSISSIGQIILELRKAKGSTQEELANAVGISPQAVSKWENGSSPDTELLPLIADYFNVPIDRLFGRTTHPVLSDTVNRYIFEPGTLKGFDRAFDIYSAMHWGLSQPTNQKKAEFQDSPNVTSHKWSEEGYSLLTSNGYGNLVTKEFWESIDLETAAFARELFELLAEPGMFEVLFANLRRKHDSPANFNMIKTALSEVEYSDEIIQECLDKLVKREMIHTENSAYEEIGKTYGFRPELSPGHWYLGLCSVICATQVLKMTGAYRNFYGLGAWPINL